MTFICEYANEYGCPYIDEEGWCTNPYSSLQGSFCPLREREDILKELRRHLHTRARNRGRGGAEAIYHLARANIAKKKGGSRWL